MQAKSLIRTIDSIQQYRLYFDTMLQVYKTQKIDKIEAMFNQPEFGLQEGMEFLLDRRNENWVVQLKDILKKGTVERHS